MSNKLMNQVVKLTSDYFGIDEADITGECRKSGAVIPRHLCMYLIYKYVLPSKSEIARYFDMHHTSASHGIEQATAYKEIRSHLEFLEPYVSAAVLKERRINAEKTLAT